jgi:peptide/nickel transport system permease protein
MVIVGLHLAVALAAPLIVPQDPAFQDAGAMLQPPSLTHWFGTDRLGRDVFSRTLLGGREAMLIATIATVIAMV